MNKPVAYLLDRTLAVHALVLAMRRVLERQAQRGENVTTADSDLQRDLPIEGEVE